jgi:hypothetical protein
MNTNAKVFLAVLILAAAGATAYVFMTRWHGASVEEAREQEKAQWEKEKEGLQKKIGDLEGEIALHKEGIVSEERLEEVFGKDAGNVARGDGDRSCEEMDREILDFFSYMDKQEYVKKAGLRKGSYARYLQLVDSLSRNTPLILEEMKDNYSLVRNVAHFYRVLGKKNLLLIRKTIVEESEVIEPVSALFYDWTVSTDRCKGGIKGRPSLKIMYEYTAFFLNTLAGKSYLFRRDSKVRILTTYYSILALDLANQETLNRYGIDIRPFINRSIQDIRNQQGLLFKKRYLDTLEQLKKDYTLQ